MFVVIVVPLLTHCLLWLGDGRAEREREKEDYDPSKTGWLFVLLFLLQRIFIYTAVILTDPFEAIWFYYCSC